MADQGNTKSSSNHHNSEESDRLLEFIEDLQRAIEYSIKNHSPTGPYDILMELQEWIDTFLRFTKNPKFITLISEITEQHPNLSLSINIGFSTKSVLDLDELETQYDEKTDRISLPYTRNHLLIIISTDFTDKDHAQE